MVGPLLLSDGLEGLPNSVPGDRKPDRMEIDRAILGRRGEQRIFRSESSCFKTVECVFARENAVATRGAKWEREWMRLLG